MNEQVKVVEPVTTNVIELKDLPTSSSKLRQWLVDVAARQDIYQDGRMRKLTDRETVVVLREGFKLLNKIETAREAERQTYLLNRFGTVLVPLDAAQPAEGDIIIAERKGERAQCVVEGGNAWFWKNGLKGAKFCAVVKMDRWRKCDVPDRPANPQTVAGQVSEALERGKAIVGNGAGLAARPGMGPATSEIRHLKK